MLLKRWQSYRADNVLAHDDPFNWKIDKEWYFSEEARV